MATISQAEQYLRVVGRLVPPDTDDKTWLLIVANGYANGLIGSVDWDSAQGNVLMTIIDEVYPDYEKWVSDEGLDPTEF